MKNSLQSLLRNYDQILVWIMLAFLAMHIGNHLALAWGADAHIAVMDKLRSVYRFPVFEVLLVVGIIIQTRAGILQMRKFGPLKTKGKLRVLVWTGLYLIIFLVIHLSAVGFARFARGIDTNLYFGVAGYRFLPAMLFFYPYYFLAVFSAFAHIGSVLWLRKRAKEPRRANALFWTGIVSGLVIAIAITLLASGQLFEFDVPASYLDVYR